jgi:phosphomannomutase
MKTKIKFGTDGWRGIIASDFTFDNVTLVATAVARVMKKIQPADNTMVVGFDRRFLSREFAQTCASVYAQHGFKVLITENYVPTPALSWTVKNTPSTAGGTMITASHNPFSWNGFKFKEKFGGSASNAMTDLFEKEIETITSHIESPSIQVFNELVAKKQITVFNPMEKYFQAVLGQIDTQAITNAKFNVGVDAMYGAGSSHFAKLLQSIGVKVTEIHSSENPMFGGTPPEPVEKNLSELSTLIKNQKLDCGLATDGDADRLGAIDEFGNSFTTQKILSVVYWHMLVNKKKPWNISRSVSTTRLVDLIAEKNGKKCFETPVGFKNIAQEMVKGNAQIGGEESGGIGITDHVMERDGLFTGLLLLEMMAKTGKKLAQIYKDLCAEIRPYEFTRMDLHVSADVMKNAMEKLSKNTPKEWLGRKVQTLLTIDGFKFYMEDGSWILIRPSGTEPIFRLYSEAETLDASQKLLDHVKAYVLNN